MASPTILGAVTSLFLADAGLASVMSVGTGDKQNPIVGQIEEGTPLPVCQIRHLGEVPDYNTSAQTRRPYIEKTRLQFAVYAVGAQSAENIGVKVKAAFDFAQPAVTGATVQGLIRKNYQVNALDLRDPNGDLVFEVLIDYEAWVQQSGIT